MTELPVLLASGVRRTPDLSGVEIEKFYFDFCSYEFGSRL